MVKIGKWRHIKTNEWKFGDYLATLSFVTVKIRENYSYRKTKVVVKKNNNVVFEQNYMSKKDAYQTLIKIQRILR